MADEERTGSCILQPCPRDPLPGFEPVCGPHRSRVAGQLRDIPILCDELRGEEPADFTKGEERIEEKADHLVDLDGELAAVVRVEHLHVLGVNAGAIAGQSSAPRVKGSREAPVPISLDRVDLLSDAHALNLVKAYDPDAEEWRVPHPEDQIGHLSAATVLDGWCAMFAEERRESVPTPRPADQSRWLLDRLDELFKHPAIDEAAKEVGDLWHVLRRACGLTTPKPEICQGIPCRSIECDLKTLVRLPGSQFIECSSCGNLLTEDEYQEWCRMVRAPLCGQKHGDWYCALPKKHVGDCEPYRGEDE